MANPIMTKNQLLIKIIIIEAANTLAYRHYSNGRINREQFELMTNKHLQQLDEIEKLAIQHGID